MDSLAKFRRNVERMNAAQRKAVERMFHAIASDKPKQDVQEAAANVVEVYTRTERKRASDAATDPIRRVTIAARVRREDAERYRQVAQDSGRSVYRLVIDALEAECERADLTHFQYSVLRGEITPSKLISLENELKKVIDKQEDFVCIIKLKNDNVFGEDVLGMEKKDVGEQLIL